MISLGEATNELTIIDLLHVDIQGGELALVEECLDLLQEKCASMLIGTHSREIEGRLSQILLANGWKLDVERPAIVRLVDGVPVVIVDGVQGWRNPKISPEP